MRIERSTSFDSMSAQNESTTHRKSKSQDFSRNEELMRNFHREPEVRFSLIQDNNLAEDMANTLRELNKLDPKIQERKAKEKALERQINRDGYIPFNGNGESVSGKKEKHIVRPDIDKHLRRYDDNGRELPKEVKAKPFVPFYGEGRTLGGAEADVDSRGVVKRDELGNPMLFHDRFVESQSGYDSDAEMDFLMNSMPTLTRS